MVDSIVLPVSTARAASGEITSVSWSMFAIIDCSISESSYPAFSVNYATTSSAEHLILSLKRSITSSTTTFDEVLVQSIVFFTSIVIPETDRRTLWVIETGITANPVSLSRQLISVLSQSGLRVQS